MASTKNTLTASEQPMTDERSIDAAKIWISGALSMIFRNRKMFPEEYFLPAHIQSTPARLSYENFVSSTALVRSARNGQAVPLMNRASGDRPAQLMTFLENVIFPELEKKTLSALVFFVAEDHVSQNEVLESYSLIVKYEGQMRLNVVQGDSTNRKSLAVGAVNRDLIACASSLSAYLAELPPLPEFALGYFQTLHADKRDQPPMSMQQIMDGPHRWPVKSGWQPQGFRPPPVRLGQIKYESLHMGGIAMKATNGDRGAPIRTRSAPELAYIDDVTPDQELAQLIDSSGIMEPMKQRAPRAGEQDGDLDLHQPLETNEGATFSQTPSASLGDQGRRSELREMRKAKPITPTQRDTQVRIASTYDTNAPDIRPANELDSFGPLAKRNQDRGDLDPEKIRCVCGSSEIEGEFITCATCQILQHAHCWGYFESNLAVDEIHHLCMVCNPATTDAEGKQQEDFDTDVIVRRLIFHLLKKEPLTAQRLADRTGTTREIVEGLMNSLEDSRYVRKAKQHRGQPVWALDDSHSAELRRRFWKEATRRQPPENSTPEIPRSDLQSQKTGLGRGSKRARQYDESAEEWSPSVRLSKRARTTDVNDNDQVPRTPAGIRQNAMMHVPRRSPRIAYQSRFQHDNVFRLSATWRTPK
ncbi:Hypothetical protein D9617_3g019440 [Elsinoe fawcettii]|nr:Hypothetical protein D9617_3g019440 [Elsinoe fawcettii]